MANAAGITEGFEYSLNKVYIFPLQKLKSNYQVLNEMLDR